MIEVLTKIHDKYSIEFKTSFVTRRKLKENDFSANMWFFVPYSLDINKDTYPKTKFYQDIKSNIRLKTPLFLLQDIVGGEAIPLNTLRESFETLASKPTRTATRDYEYQIKMFAAITHSASRDACIYIMSSQVEKDDVPTLCKKFAEEYDAVLEQYRNLRAVISQPTITPAMMKYYGYGDEYLSNLKMFYCTRLLAFLQKQTSKNFSSAIELLQKHIAEENKYREKHHFYILKENDEELNRKALFRHRVLKRYVDSDLFLDVSKKKDGQFVEQLYFGIAAGLAMVFATMVSFHFQQKFGNFTLPFFIVLVISYMIKDRIKELSRFYFAHRIGSKFYDNRADIHIKDEKIGSFKESMDFISGKKVPDDVKRVRYTKRLMEVENRVTDEKVLFYRMKLRINRDKLNSFSVYDTTGINDIIRFNVNSLLKKMDNPKTHLQIMNEEGNVTNVLCDKLYYINIILQLNSDDTTTLRRFRVALTRNGIDSIEEIK